MVAASFFVETNSPTKYRLSNKKDIADDPTLVVTPKLFFKNSCFLVYRVRESGEIHRFLIFTFADLQGDFDFVSF